MVYERAPVVALRMMRMEILQVKDVKFLKPTHFYGSMKAVRVHTGAVIVVSRQIIATTA